MSWIANSESEHLLVTALTCGVLFAIALSTIYFSIACYPFNLSWKVHNLYKMSIEYSHCHTLYWKAEFLISSTLADIKFDMCCYQEKISLIPLN